MMRRCDATRCGGDVCVCVDSGREMEEHEAGSGSAALRSTHICGQSLKAVRAGWGNGKWKSSRPLAAYRALSRRWQRCHDSSATLSSAERERERNERMSRVKVT